MAGDKEKTTDVRIDVQEKPLETPYTSLASPKALTASDTSLWVSRAGFFSGITTACSAASGASGAAILQAAGFSAYNVQQSTAAGATGGAALSITLGMVLAYCVKLSEGSTDQSRHNAIAGFLLSAGISALSGALGYALLYTTNDTEMTLGQCAAATALGTAIIDGSIAALGALCRWR